MMTFSQYEIMVLFHSELESVLNQGSLIAPAEFKSAKNESTSMLPISEQ